MRQRNISWDQIILLARWLDIEPQVLIRVCRGFRG
jgi:hypothetical protein